MSKVWLSNLLRRRKAEDADVDAAGVVAEAEEVGALAGGTTPKRELGRTRTNLARPITTANEVMIKRWLEVAWEHHLSSFDYHEYECILSHAVPQRKLVDTRPFVIQ